mmetsp:Transcript_27403/g.56091  ORF Transcript_27403/g.56091 Transcript_27403/m.56091 type:complete len:290 (-) Transcript_27403:991-1860(-)
MLVQRVLTAQQPDVCPQRHLPEAVGVEVELVLDDVGEVFVDGRQLLQRLAVRARAQAVLPELDLVPHALHVEEVVGVVAILGEERDDALRELPPVRPQRVPHAHRVQEPISKVHTARSLALIRCLRQISGVFEDARLGQVQVDHRGSVKDGGVDEFERLGRVAAAIEVVCQKLQHPQVRRWRLYLISAGHRLGGLQGIQVAHHHLLDQRHFPRVLVQRFHVRKEGGDALAEGRGDVGGKRHLELLPCQEVQRNAAHAGTLGVLGLQLLVQGQQLRLLLPVRHLFVIVST